MTLMVGETEPGEKACAHLSSRKKLTFCLDFSQTMGGWEQWRFGTWRASIATWVRGFASTQIQMVEADVHLMWFAAIFCQKNMLKHSSRSLIKTSNYYFVSLSDVRSLSLPRRESIGRRVGRGTWEDRNTCDQFWFERLLLPKPLLLSWNHIDRWNAYWIVVHC